MIERRKYVLMELLKIIYTCISAMININKVYIAMNTYNRLIPSLQILSVVPSHANLYYRCIIPERGNVY